MNYRYGWKQFWDTTLDKLYQTVITKNTASQYIKTPFELIEEMISKIPKINGEILVFNIEFAIYLVEELKINPSQITVWIDNNFKLAFLIKLGIHKIISKEFISEKHIYIYNLKTEEKYVDMKFDVILINPPYNVGLLKRSKAFICNTNNNIINSAARKRIDAAFVVLCYENLLKDGGISMAVWPYAWTQFSSWSDFREWMSKSGLIEIFAIKSYFSKEVAIANAVTIQKKGYTGDSYYNNIYRNSNIKIDWNYDIIPNAYGEIGLSIFKKEQKYPIKTLMSSRHNVEKNFIGLGGGYGLGGKSGAINLTLKDFKKTKNMAGPYRKEESKTKGNYPVIVFDNKEHKERYIKYFESALYRFILHQRKIDYHNTKSNIGLMPDITKNMIGDYSYEKAYAELCLSREEINFIEEIAN